MVDISIATSLIELSIHKEPVSIDTIMIISGDKDLIPAIRLVRDKFGKEIFVAGFRHKDPGLNSLAYEIDREVDGVVNIFNTLRRIGI